MLKPLVKNAASLSINATGRLLRAVAARRNPSADGLRYALLAPTSQGSLGDEAVITAACQHLKAERRAHITLIGFDQVPWEKIRAIDERVPIPNYYASGGWPERLALRHVFANIDGFYVMGTDMLDGHYNEWQSIGLLTLAEQAVACGVPTNLVGFSLKDAPPPSIAASLRRLAARPGVKACIRDVVSRRCFLQSVSASSELTADPAFLLEPDDAFHPLREWIAERKSLGDMIIAVNLSSHVLGMLEVGAGGHLIEAIASVLNDLATAGAQLSVMLVPHDLRERFDDLPLCEAIRCRLEANGIVSSRVLMPPFSAGLVKSLTGAVDLVLSSRMHLAIAALGSGTPAVCLTYQGKFEGLFAHFGLDDCTIAPADALQQERLKGFLSGALARRAAMAESITVHLARVCALARENFAFSLPTR